jgi:hypothetical protein
MGAVLPVIDGNMDKATREIRKSENINKMVFNCIFF